ncbi:MAG: aldehyde dehydrogenase [Candidatus Babeliales bacterium]
MKQQIITSLNPNNNFEVIGSVSISTSDEIHTKVTAARNAQAGWAALGFKSRIAILEALYKEFVKRKEEIKLLAAQEMGMPIKVSEQVDLGAGLSYMRGYLDNAEKWLAPEIIFENELEIHYLSFEPIGVAGISIPWNFPFCNFIWGVIPHLAVGNTVVIKHSEECSLVGKLLDNIMQSVGLPAGVFNQVYGDGSSVGEVLMNSAIDILHFTGSTGVGKHLYQVAAQKFIPVILELGGSAPGIVCEDADLDLAIESIYFNRFANSGQTCDGLKRLIVHDSIFDEVVTRLKELINTKIIGNAQEISTDIGPVVSKRQLNTLEEQVADALNKGAKVIMGGKKPTNLQGAYYEPTILTNISFDMRVWKDEVFAPILPIVPFTIDDQAIALANDTQYGLGAYVYSKSKDRALRIANALKTGDVSINTAYYGTAHDPFGGYKNSGLGREHGKHGFRELCNAKVIAIKK